MLEHVDDFLRELTQANRSPHTLRGYAADLKAYWGELTAAALREYFASLTHLGAATRARKQAAFSAFCRWAVRHGHLTSSPMELLERIRLEAPPPRGITRDQFVQILQHVRNGRDRLLFRLLFETGLRIAEALNLHLEDLDLRTDDEHLSVIGKGGKRRTLLLDDPTLVREIRRYLCQTGYRHGLLFRAEKNGSGGPLRYQSIEERWRTYCEKAGVPCTLHQLRHAHATELANDGVSLGTIRKRLGHRHIQTTLRYVELTDRSADLELRRRRNPRSS